MASRRTHLRVTRDGVQGVHDAIKELLSKEVLVGFPEETTDDREDATEPTNAALGYIHDNGAPEVNIPARPFMVPAIEEAQDRIADGLGEAARMAMRPGKANPELIDKMLHRVGFIAEVAIKTKINEGIPPPLSERTLQARASRGREGAAWDLAWRAAGVDPSMTMELAKPLVDTGQMRNAVKYVIRDRKKRSQ